MSVFFGAVFHAAFGKDRGCSLKYAGMCVCIFDVFFSAFSRHQCQQKACSQTTQYFLKPGVEIFILYVTRLTHALAFSESTSIPTGKQSH